jgi:hypothetical protein
MSVQNYVQQFAAGQTSKFPGGRAFYIRQASSPVNIVTYGKPASPVNLTGIAAGSKLGPVPVDLRWDYLEVTSPAAQTVEVVISDEGEFEEAGVVTIAGTVTVTQLPASSMTDLPPVSVPSGVLTALIAANTSRKRVTVCVPSTPGLSSVFLRSAGGANNLLEVQAGTFVSLTNTAAISAFQSSGAAVDVLILEEV